MREADSQLGCQWRWGAELRVRWLQSLIRSLLSHGYCAHRSKYVQKSPPPLGGGRIPNHYFLVKIKKNSRKQHTRLRVQKYELNSPLILEVLGKIKIDQEYNLLRSPFLLWPHLDVVFSAVCPANRLHSGAEPRTAITSSIASFSALRSAVPNEGCHMQGNS
jgi:hypothetical protein